MGNDLIIQRTAHGLTTSSESYLREQQLGVKRAWLRGFVCVNSCQDITDPATNNQSLVIRFYGRDSKGNTYGDWNHVTQENITFSHATDGGFHCQYVPMVDFIVFDEEAGSYALHYTLTGITSRCQVQLKWILESEALSSA